MIEKILIHLVLTPLLSGLLAYIVVKIRTGSVRDWTGWVHVRPKDLERIDLSPIASQIASIDMCDIGDVCEELILGNNNLTKVEAVIEDIKFDCMLGDLRVNNGNSEVIVNNTLVFGICMLCKRGHVWFTVTNGDISFSSKPVVVKITTEDAKNYLSDYPDIWKKHFEEKTLNHE